MIPIRTPDIQTANKLTEKCPIEVIELEHYLPKGTSEDADTHAMVLRLLPSEKADLFMAGYAQVLFTNLGLLLFCNFALTLIILKTIDGEAHHNSTILQVSMQDAKNNKKRQDSYCRVGQNFVGFGFYLLYYLVLHCLCPV
jgi:hypothetical protein